MLQLYRLFVVYSENQKSLAMKKKAKYQNERYVKSRAGRCKRRGSDDIYTISNEKSSKSKSRKYDSDDSDERRRDKKKSVVLQNLIP